MPASRNLKIDTAEFEYSEAGALRRKLRKDAIDDARRGAQDMADAAGKKLGTLFNVADRPQISALMETKREFAVHPQWSAPLYWAAFVLYGV